MSFRRSFVPLVALAWFLVASGALARAQESGRPKPLPSPSPSPSPAASASPGPSLLWRSIGPAVSGGRVATVAGTDLDPALLYAGAAGGGVWRSTNAGTDWTPVFDKAGTQSIGAIAISPRDKNDVWVGTGEPWPRNDVIPGDGIYHSADGGKSWTRMGLTATSQIARVLLDPRDARRIVVAALGDPFRDTTERGVFRSTDGGKTWEKTLYLGPSLGASDLAMDPKNPDVLYAGMWRFRRSSWSLSSGGEGDGIYKSTDGGATWKRITGSGLPAGSTGRIAIAIAPSDNKRIYALIESKDGMLWRSDDAGTSWKMTSSNTLINERPFYYSRVIVDPHDADHLFSVSVLLAESKNGGKTWHVSGRRLHGDHHDMWIAAGGRAIIEGNDGGVALSHDGGATWTWRNVLPVSQFYHVGYDLQSPYHVCGGLQDNGSWCAPARTGDPRGVLPGDWVKVSGGDGTWVVPNPRNPQSIWSTSGGGDNQGEMIRFDGRTQSQVDVSPYLRDQNVVAPTPLEISLQLGDADRIRPPRRARGVRGRQRAVPLDRRRHALDADQPGPHPQPQRTARALGRPAHARRDRRRDVRHAARDRSFTAREEHDLDLDRRRRGAAHARRRQALVERLDPGRRRGRPNPEHRALTLRRRHGVRRRRPPLCGRPRAVRLRDARLRQELARDHERAARERGARGARRPAQRERAVRGHGKGRVVERRRGRVVEALPRPAAAGRGARSRRAAQLRRLDRRDARPRYVRVRRPHRAARARRRGAADAVLFAPRDALPLQRYTPTVNARGGADAPQAAFTFWQQTPAKKTPSLEIVDAHGTVVRHIAGTHEEDGEDVPNVGNLAGYNRVTWDLGQDAPTPWRRIAPWDRGPDSGAPVLSGRYTLRLLRDGKTYTQPLRILPDRRIASAQDELRGYRFQTAFYAELSELDDALNALDNVRLQLPERIAAIKDPALADRARAVLAEAKRVEGTISSQPVNDQDDDFLEDLLRERVLTFIGNFAPGTPTGPQLTEGAVLHREGAAALAGYRAFVAQQVQPLNDALRAAGATPLDLNALPPKTKPDPNADEHARRGEATE